jgi:thioredoxin reductase (NADPH)
MYDVIIVGAGPAGLTAAVYLRRANKSVLILDKAAFGGQIAFSPKVENYPGFETVTGAELADKMVEQALSQGAEVEVENVISLKDENGIKTVYTEDGNEYSAKAVIIAVGAKHRHLGIENEEKFFGEGISFCAVCDGAFYQDKHVALIGGGNSALQEAILLSETSKKVTVVQNLDFLTGEKRLQEIIASRDNIEVICGAVVDSIKDTDTFSGVIIKKGDELIDLTVDGMFIAIGLEPDNTPFKEVCDLNEWGYVIADEDCLTKTPGVFVAGDCRTKKLRQITTATSDGAYAAVNACRYIDQ